MALINPDWVPAEYGTNTDTPAMLNRPGDNLPGDGGMTDEQTQWYYTGQIKSIFRSAAGREPTAGEVATWLKLITQSGNPTMILQSLTDRLTAEKAKGASATTDTGTSGAPSTAGVVASAPAGAVVNEAYLRPFTQEFSFAPFQAPTGADVLNDPSYLWGRDQAIGAYQNSAASKGLLNQTGAGYDIGAIANNLAQTAYGNIYDRRFNLWNQQNQDAWRKYVESKNTWYMNQDQPWRKLFESGSLGAQAASA